MALATYAIHTHTHTKPVQYKSTCARNGGRSMKSCVHLRTTSAIWYLVHDKLYPKTKNNEKSQRKKVKLCVRCAQSY